MTRMQLVGFGVAVLAGIGTTPLMVSAQSATKNRAAKQVNGTTVYYRNCAAARAAGAAPVYRGDPGYAPHLDRDNDGIGCEPYRGRRRR